MPAGASSLVAGDLDADGDLDLAVAAGTSAAEGGVSILRNRGNGRFGAAETRGVGTLGGIASYTLAMGSVDGDGTPDLVVANGFESNFSVLTNEVLREGSHFVELRTDIDVAAGVDFVLQQHQSTVPTGIDLAAGSDTGTLNFDDVTRLDNSSAASRLTFTISGTTPGALVLLMHNGVEIGRATASGVTTSITTNGSVDLVDGPRSLVAKQRSVGKALSLHEAGR